MKILTYLTKCSPLALAGVISFLLPNQVQAQKINWGGAANSVNVDSAGAVLNDATYTFELGTFTNNDDPLTEFVPNAGNTDFWGSSWVALDTASYNDTNRFFSDSWVVADDTYEGFQAYIWVYNNQVGDETSEWVLITDNTTGDAWKIPESNGTQQDFPNQWRVSTATTPIFGGLNDTDGPGERSDDPGTFELQTNTFLPVPEPRVPLLALIAGAVLFGRRHRN